MDVNGMWSGYIGEGAKTVLPSIAQAKISFRLVPGQDNVKISELAKKHIESIAPASVKVEVKSLHGGQGYSFPKGAPPVKDGDKIRTIPKIKNIEIKASNKMMLITVEATSKIDKSKDESKVGKTVCVSEIGIVVMPGGY